MSSYDISFSDLKGKIDSFSDKINSLTDNINWLTNRVNSLESDMANLSIEFILNEFSERQQLANNILIFNLPEQKNSVDSPDATAVSELFKNLDLNISPVK